jgi:hypothetical protein
MTRAVILLPALTARQAVRPRTGRARTAAVLIRWRGGFGFPRYPAPGPAAGQPAARPAPGGTETRDGAR